MTRDQSILIQLMRSGGSEVPNEGGHIILRVIDTIYTEVANTFWGKIHKTSRKTPH